MHTSNLPGNGFTDLGFSVQHVWLCNLGVEHLHTRTAFSTNQRAGAAPDPIGPSKESPPPSMKDAAMPAEVNLTKTHVSSTARVYDVPRRRRPSGGVEGKGLDPPIPLSTRSFRTRVSIGHPSFEHRPFEVSVGLDWSFRKSEARTRAPHEGFHGVRRGDRREGTSFRTSFHDRRPRRRHPGSTGGAEDDAWRVAHAMQIRWNEDSPKVRLRRNPRCTPTKRKEDAVASADIKGHESGSSSRTMQRRCSGRNGQALDEWSRRNASG